MAVTSELILGHRTFQAQRSVLDSVRHRHGQIPAMTRLPAEVDERPRDRVQWGVSDDNCFGGFRGGSR